MSERQTIPRAVFLQGIRKLATFLIVLGAVMFLAAGDIRWVRGWLFLLVFLVLVIPSAICLWRVNPEIFVARGQIHAGTKPWDKVLIVLLLVSFLAVLVVAPLDAARFHWSSVPLWLSILGYVLLCVNFFLSVWGESVNKFAEPTVRLQTDRGQKVVDTGPYAIVRHPLYLGGFFLCAGIPLTLGSFWALIPSAVATVVLVVRTILEDRMLQKELEGYKAYAARVPHRLIPGVW